MDKLKDENLFYIGGIVRDEILGIKNFDLDFCYQGNAINFANNKKLNIIKQNEDLGTVRIIYNDIEIDIASTREEAYPQKGHLPKITSIGCPLINDLKRRDFTMNAMAKNSIRGELIDFFNGKNDIKEKKIRILHKESFIDDPSRILRALKFSVRFNFELEEQTKFLQDAYLNNINYDMSYHRIKKELVDTFKLNKAEAFDKFINNKMYRLLSAKDYNLNINSSEIQETIENNIFEYPYMLYLAMFDSSKLQLTRGEKRIIEWIERLKLQKPTNNTPKESIAIAKLMRITV
ncbi:CCA tRNA nucleotidyltransferase [bacterium]|nr:CCA tRNA nucleotidyltransferase [bacterium]